MTRKSNRSPKGVRLTFFVGDAKGKSFQDFRDVQGHVEQKVNEGSRRSRARSQKNLLHEKLPKTRSGRQKGCVGVVSSCFDVFCYWLCVFFLNFVSRGSDLLQTYHERSTGLPESHKGRCSLEEPSKVTGKERGCQGGADPTTSFRS